MRQALDGGFILNNKVIIIIGGIVSLTISPTLPNSLVLLLFEQLEPCCFTQFSCAAHFQAARTCQKSLLVSKLNYLQ